MYTIFLSHKVKLAIVFVICTYTVYNSVYLFSVLTLTINVIEGCQILQMYIYFGSRHTDSKRACLRFDVSYDFILM
jgi:hypothetical protein